MQPKTSQLAGRSLLLAMATFLFAGFFSCGKRTETATPHTRMDQAAQLLQGEKKSGTLMGVEDEGSLTLNYNNGSQYILVDMLPGLEDIEAFSMMSAELITSEYGIVIRDLGNDKLVFLANNDDESIRRMQRVRTLLNEEATCPTVFGTIFGTTLVNPPSHKKGI